MGSPMTLPDVCALCFEPYGDGTFDVTDTGLVLVNVCTACRIAETRAWIMKD
ncbi:hypothetical protein [Streptomyces hydrogenans]|uniref:Uncharacterized protein n=1 Tax=Streptomyces hydrogenans TaxID=1873719 RepID=A0ABQ3PJL1_9ACTN|nr:hypothetical protein [Streptomyces hydrogenans]GHG10088.1 hypothetical protein GCM10018784_23460 [Streptomyces hydrogenans]GHI25202.1 hypothetical protein Shyd_65730 [Streptomyces hydrogenans]